ncbi:MAG: argininosuccinate synthase [Actinobacteria bacterium RBG_16_64_13]|nr:MAG: argininosuccinate synthase [Actinobacteria bacterium RBG_16_64_13]
MSKEKCILAYSGGLDTSALVPYMKEKYGYEIIAVLVDVGRMKDVEGLRQRALTAGAADSLILDAKEEFLVDFAFPALKANALYEGRYPLHSALSRPLIAKKMVEVAHRYGAKVAAHGCTAKGNDQVRIDVSVRCLDPSITVLGPAREWNMTRPELLDYLSARGIDLPITKKNPYSIDENLWGRAIECGELEDPWTAAPAEAFQFTVDPKAAPDEAAELVIGFEAGIPVSLDGERLDPITLVESVDMLGGAHGFGRLDMVENRLVGIKSREVYEEAGSLSLIMAHREVEDLTLTRELQHFKTMIDQRLSELIYDGLWFSPLARALRAFIDESQKYVSGEVRLRYFKGACSPVGRRSPHSLYDSKLATYGSGDTFSHESAKGFIQLWGLPVEVWARHHKDQM